MDKWLCWGSMGIGGLVTVLFLLDLVIKIPFGGLSSVVDILGLIAGALVTYLSWETSRDVV